MTTEAHEDSSVSLKSEGSTSLQVASSHLSTLLSATDAIDGKAMFVMAVNLAMFTAFAGAVVGLPLSLWSLLAPGLILVAVMAKGWQAAKPRSMKQFNHPEGLLENESGGYDGDTLAWAYVSAIQKAAVDVRSVIQAKRRALRWAEILSLIHLIALVTCAAVWFDGSNGSTC